MDINSNLKKDSGMEVEEGNDKDGGLKRCAFYLIKKKRNCKLYAREGKEYCVEHGHLEVDDGQSSTPEDSRRVPCPLDPKHTVYRHKLVKHLKVCNAIPAYPFYFQKDINLLPHSATMEGSKLRSLTEVQLGVLLQKVSTVFDQVFREFHRKIGLTFDDVDDQGTDSATPVAHAEKHNMQVKSLCGILDNYALILPKTTFIEMGSGTGEFTCGLIEYMQRQGECIKTSKFVLVDRESHRHKLDTKLKYESDLDVTRIRIDIKDLALESLPSVQAVESVVAHSKHLCGEATDFALYALLNGTMANKIAGMVIATCCHHRCEWNSFVGKAFLLESGFDESDFGPLIGMSSWAVCGSGIARLTEANQHDMGTNPIYQKLHLTHGKRREYGYKVKKILDFARVRFVESRGLDGVIKTYARENVTGENSVIVARKNTWMQEFREFIQFGSATM